MQKQENARQLIAVTGWFPKMIPEQISRKQTSQDDSHCFNFHNYSWIETLLVLLNLHSMHLFILEINITVKTRVNKTIHTMSP